jgi:hypothetical protein
MTASSHDRRISIHDALQHPWFALHSETQQAAESFSDEVLIKAATFEVPTNSPGDKYSAEFVSRMAGQNISPRTYRTKRVLLKQSGLDAQDFKQYATLQLQRVHEAKNVLMATHLAEELI